MCFTGCEAADVCSLIKFCKTAAGSSAKHLAELCGLTFFLPAPFSAMQSLTYPFTLRWQPLPLPLRISPVRAVLQGGTSHFEVVD